jgi:DNA-binding transcriptional regulator YdaS (Cro superfamily)
VTSGRCRNQVSGAAAATIRNVTGGDVLRRILRRCDLSAGELAGRMGVTESQVAAWIHGDPPLSVVNSAAEACSADLAAVIAEPEPDPHDVSLLETTSAMTVDQRLQRLKAYVRFVQAGRAALGHEP